MKIVTLVQERDYAMVILAFWLRFYTRGICSQGKKKICLCLNYGPRHKQGLMPRF